MLLDQHGWTGTAFSQKPDLQCLLDELKNSSDLYDDSSSEGDKDDEPPAQYPDDVMFTNPASKQELQHKMDMQSFGHDLSTIESFEFLNLFVNVCPVSRCFSVPTC